MLGINKNKKTKRKLTLLSEKSSFGYIEAYKSLRTNMTYLLKEKDDKTGQIIMIASSMPGEGKSNVSVNLSIALSQDNKKVILLDCDLRKGTLHRYLNVPALSAGITSVLNKESDLQSAIKHMSFGFDFMPVGTIPDNPSELIGSTRMNTLLRVLSKNYDYVICDTAPVNAVSDTSILCRYMDGTILVVSHNDVARNTALAAKEQLENSGANILGVVLNRYDAKKTGTDAAGYYSYYNYSTYEGYGDDQQ